MFFQKFYFVDLNYMFALTGHWLRIFGIWPDPHISLSNLRRPSIRFIIIISTITLFLSAPQMMNVIRAWGNLTRMVENFVSANFSLLAVFKLLVTWYHGKSKFTFRDNTNVEQIYFYRPWYEMPCYIPPLFKQKMLNCWIMFSYRNLLVLIIYIDRYYIHILCSIWKHYSR